MRTGPALVPGSFFLWGSSVTDTAAKPHDRVAVNAGHALDGADAHAPGEGGNDFNLLVAAKDVHDRANPSLRVAPKPTLEKQR